MTEKSYWLHASHNQLASHIRWLEDEREKLTDQRDAARVSGFAMAGALERIAQALGARADADPAWIAGETIARLRRCPGVEWVCPDCGGDREQCACTWAVEGE